MRKYQQLLSMFITRYLTYRARVFIWLFTDSAQYILFPFLWMAIFAQTAPPGGYSVKSLVTYYVIMAVVSTGFVSHCSRHVRTEIQSGFLSRRLTVPFPYFNLILMAEFSYKCLSTIISAAALILLYIFAYDYLIVPDSWLRWLAFLISIFFTFAISHLLEFLIGLATFWIGDTKSLSTIEEIVNAIFSGRLAPLLFLPPVLQSVAGVLPFKYLAFVPAEIFVGQIAMADIPRVLGIGLLWVVSLGTLIAILWRRGLKNYDGFGM